MTIFFVNILSELGTKWPWFSVSFIFIYMLFCEIALDSATYNWPWAKTGFGKYIPKKLYVWPCDLFIVMANAIIIGNCLRLNE